MVIFALYTVTNYEKLLHKKIPLLPGPGKILRLGQLRKIRPLKKKLGRKPYQLPRRPPAWVCYPGNENFLDLFWIMRPKKRLPGNSGNKNKGMSTYSASAGPDQEHCYSSVTDLYMVLSKDSVYIDRRPCRLLPKLAREDLKLRWRWSLCTK
jgi:hypothetical protein